VARRPQPGLEKARVKAEPVPDLGRLLVTVTATVSASWLPREWEWVWLRERAPRRRPSTDLGEVALLGPGLMPG
jgi:hypothetical protein